ncbi:DNA polymerase/3'-5' exonuclease PolX [Candidatus Dojkabacteria bacterium]|nr:DNA polymerase/3'-5' exonuclease PolX [Candidatus Dojkabacteria bacterium]
MIIHNNEIAQKLDEMGDLLAIKGANKYRIRAYKNAARSIRSQGRRIDEMIDSGEDLTQLDSVGKDLASKIKEIVSTGELSDLKKLKNQLPSTLLNLLDLEGLGPKRVKRLYDVLEIETQDDLKKAADNEKIREVKGFGKKTENNIREQLLDNNEKDRRFRIDKVEELIEPFRAYLQNIDTVSDLVIAGSYRRRKETVGDIDFLVIATDSKNMIEAFTKYEEVKKVISKGNTKSSVMLKTELQVDLRVVEKRSKAPALLYFTGSKKHNIKLRKLGIDKGYKINEYGVFKDDKRIKCETEEDIYKLLNLEYIEPELRENRGEIKAAKRNKLPDLIENKDIKGDLQMHTKHSDGSSSIKEMVEKAIEIGYEYIAITDHSSYIGVTNGLSDSEIPSYLDELKRVDEEYSEINVLSGIEVDVLEDGKLDLTDESLKRMDVVIFSIHSHFNLEEKKQTDRILTAMDNKYVNIFAHPTGRMINKREGYKYDIEKVVQHAASSNIIMEINGSPSRLDLDDINSKMASDNHVSLVINTDAHSPKELSFMKYGISQARRGWVQADEVINTLNFTDVIKKFKR